MSEYQYYEFQAVDRPLTPDEMRELRTISSRASITATRFTNEYSFGDFRGSPLQLMERYFDAHVYVANWGTRRLMLRLPRALLDAEVVYPYCEDNYVAVHITREHAILELCARDEAEWVEDAEDWLPALLSLRTELANGDLRCLYLAWLSYVQQALPAAADDAAALPDAETWKDSDAAVWDSEVDLTATEPPVPPGLATLSGALRALADFLRLDQDLLAVAAERSPALQAAAPSTDDLRRWVGALPEAAKTDLLVRLLTSNPVQVRAELLRHYRATTLAADPTRAAASGGRTVRQLLMTAHAHADTRRRAEAERQARARAAYLDNLATRETAVWREVEALIEQRQAAPYERAVELLQDLRDLAARQDAAATFAARLADLRARHARKTGLIQRLDRARLPRG